jgi:hypothetical protein
MRRLMVAVARQKETWKRARSGPRRWREAVKPRLRLPRRLLPLPPLRRLHSLRSHSSRKEEVKEVVRREEVHGGLKGRGVKGGGRGGEMKGGGEVKGALRGGRRD